jgi:uncharacterized protein YfaS (alpha-2-macroglobulin family)
MKKNHYHPRLDHLLTAFCVMFLVFTLGASETPSVKTFNPEGTVKDLRQVSVTFSEPMVALGNPADLVPFDIYCQPPGKGRWVDSTTWVYDFGTNLPGGCSCGFVLKEGLKSLSGKTLTGKKRFTFSTGGPSIIKVLPESGNSGIENRQIFIIQLDAVPDEASVISKTWFAVKGLREKIGINIIKGQDRKVLLKSARYNGPDENAIVFQAKQTFPDMADVSLIWGKGIKSLSGVATPSEMVMNYKTREQFRAKFICSRERPDAPCIPLSPMELEFTADFPDIYKDKILLKGKNGRIYRPEKQAGLLRFNGPFEENSEYLIDVPKIIRDLDGRRLANSSKFPMRVKTGGMPALAKFSSRFGILEKSDAMLPLTVRNIETSTISDISQSKKTVAGLKIRSLSVPIDNDKLMIDWLKSVAQAKREVSVFRKNSPAQDMRIDFKGRKTDFRVVGIPVRTAGLNIIEVESRMLGTRLNIKSSAAFVPAAALVTNMGVHFKKGLENSLVWVTSLDTAKPVKDAQITLRNCNGDLLWQGTTDRNGILMINSRLPEPSSLPDCKCDINYRESSHALTEICGGIFVFARKESDVSFTHSSWNEGIEPWRFQLSQTDYGDSSLLSAHTVLDRALFKPGETVHMKHYIRQRSVNGFKMASKKDFPDEIAITHTGSYQQYKLPLVLNDAGSGETDWKIPEAAKLGSYEIVLGKKGKAIPGSNEEASYESTITSGMFKIGSFKVPLMKATIQGPKELQVKPVDLNLDITLSYLSGGPAAGRSVKLRSEMRDRVIYPKGYESFTFNAGQIKTGITEDDTDFGYGVFSWDEPSQEAPANGFLKTLDITLDKNGCARAELKGLPVSSSYKTLHTELEYRDPNGEVQTTSNNTAVYPSSLLLGISQDYWNQNQERFKYNIVALDLNERPVADQKIAVDYYQETYNTHRVRMAGGYYAYKNVREIKYMGRLYDGSTDSRGMMNCTGKSAVSGNIILYAHSTDKNGNTASTSTSMWLSGKDDWWFEQSNDDRIDVIPEKTAYEPGDTARFQVRMPFREATALVTMEREGIIDARVIDISGKSPLVELPVKDEYAPNVFVSVLAVRGRIPGTKPTSMFDPGKPSYKLGISGILVGWKAHELTVDVIPDKTVYKIRDVMDVKIKVRNASSLSPAKGGEVSIAAVDEGLLELMPNDSWDILSSMMKTRGYGVETSTAQSMVVGRRHFGLKALPHGGGGGRQLTRDLFDTLLLWKGTLKLDDSGEASIRIPLNDSLTAFRIAAIAVGGAGLFGTGSASVRTSQDLMLISGLPLIAREGDSFRAVFTARNATQRKMDIRVDLSTGAKNDGKYKEITLKNIQPGQSAEAAWDIKVPFGSSGIEYTVSAAEKGGPASDRMKITQKVLPTVPVRTVQAVLARLAPSADIDIKMPEGAVTGKSHVKIDLKPSITAGLSGVREYMSRYPYSCLEQNVSKAVSLGDKAAWDEILKKLPSYMDRDFLLKYFPCGSCEGSDVLTSYFLNVSHEAGYAIPGYLKEQLITGLKAFTEGRISKKGPLLTSDLTIRKIAAIDAISRYENIDPQFISTIRTDPVFWPTSTIISWINILNRMTLQEKDKRLAEANRVLRARLVLSGTQMNVPEDSMDNLWWLMVTGDVNASRLILAVLNDKAWNNDIPRLAAGLSARMKNGRWDTTTANAWGTLAFNAFSENYEKALPAGVTKVTLNGKEFSVDWKTKPDGDNLVFSLPENISRLILTHEGTGSPWASVLLQAAVSPKSPVYAGYSLKKTITPVEQKYKDRYSIGDVLRIRLEIEATTDMTWVVVNDPVPAGASIIQPDLGASFLTGSEKAAGFVFEAFTERSADSIKKYFEYVPRGNFSTEYTIRLNCGGVFNIPPARVEALYSPDIYGEIPGGIMEINK